ncbi:MAG: hypothetical protein WEC34_07900 [Acidimicrobiia bacterium]
MRKLVRPVAALAVVGALVVALGGVAAAKDVSNEKYAKRICGELQGVLDAIDGLDQLDTSDPATYQTEAVAAADELIASMDSAKAKLKKVSPDDGGKKVTKLFTKYLTDYVVKFEAARADFAAADPASPAFTGDVTVFGVALQNAGIGLTDPFSRLTEHQDLLGAFGDEKSCDGIVEVSGG